MGRGGFVVSPEFEAGSRNGNAPLGEAWLVDGMVMKSIPRNFRYAYAFGLLVSKPVSGRQLLLGIVHQPRQHNVACVWLVSYEPAISNILD